MPLIPAQVARSSPTGYPPRTDSIYWREVAWFLEGLKLMFLWYSLYFLKSRVSPPREAGIPASRVFTHKPEPWPRLKRPRQQHRRALEVTVSPGGRAASAREGAINRMSENDDTREPTPEASRASGDEGLFSQLPRTRPGRRSPRRGSTATAGPATPAEPARKPAAMRAAAAAANVPEAQQRSPEPEPDAGPPPQPPPEGDELPAGIEDLAWAGIAVSAEAATLGVRLLGRAFDAARKAAERS